MAKIIRAGYVEDAKSYLNGIVTANVEGELAIAQYIGKFVDGLKKGWHIDSITEDADGNIRVDVVKRD